VPNTGLCQPHVQTAWAPPSPASQMVMSCSTADRFLRGERPGSSSSAARHRRPGPGR
jgi:hypothetical protein